MLKRIFKNNYLEGIIKYIMNKKDKENNLDNSDTENRITIIFNILSFFFYLHII